MTDTFSPGGQFLALSAIFGNENTGLAFAPVSSVALYSAVFFMPAMMQMNMATANAAENTRAAW